MWQVVPQQPPLDLSTVLQRGEIASLIDDIGVSTLNWKPVIGRARSPRYETLRCHIKRDDGRCGGIVIMLCAVSRPKTPLKVVINIVFTLSLRKVYLSNPRVVLLEDL